MTAIHEQSGDIAMGVDKALEYKEGSLHDDMETIGAGDQGIMFGFACNETPELMPMPISLAHKLAKQLSDVRKSGKLAYLRPDGKTQVTVEYDGDKVSRVDTILISTQHDEDVTQEQIKKDIIKYVINPIIPDSLVDDKTKYYVNPTGRFVIGGPNGDSGLTGEKNHRRHLRRIFQTRRRRFLRQRPDKGRPFCSLRGQICSEEHRSSRPGG
jgi:S-adenosylmethionine synthetase